MNCKQKKYEISVSGSSDLRVWRTNPGSVFDYDPAEDNIQSRSLHMMSGEMRRFYSLY